MAEVPWLNKSFPASFTFRNRTRVQVQIAHQCQRRQCGLNGFSTEEKVMNLIVWLVIGGVVGWLASIIMKRDAQQGIILNVVVGIIGALLAGYIISPLVGVGTINSGLSVGSFLVSLLGAVVLLAIVNLFTRGKTRV
jgi:uncharacterized membrane protein YeaQ/YmgE (transglycosylase-associated protein family)